MGAPIYSFRTVMWWSETDAAGIAHFSSIFKLCEWAEESYLKSLLGERFRDATSIDVIFPRVHASCDFERPIYAHDDVRVDIVSVRVGETSVTWEFEVYDESRGWLSARCRIVTVAVRRESMSKVRVPDELRRLLAAGVGSG